MARATAQDLDAQRAWEYGQRLLGLLILIFILPVMLLTAAAVVAQDGGPVLFKHRRIGARGRPFDCLKFRSMRIDSQERLADLLARDPAARAEWRENQKLRHDPRVTPVGDFLRRSSLDELPQLINLVRGEMNLVGPRPIVESEMVRYGLRLRHYQSVKPGITGLWQVSGRSSVGYRRRVAMDTLYARRRNVGLDLWIIARTVPAVLLKRGSY
ncbi:MAG TPA: sugar transferase [Phenylobacterium sp.]|uniref:sugar transferase n=1 Tax=Phenylobacterium sp. TaxID=1871053 RepID=UPI002B47D618|nr:sugar transferase [Phenylobacterium sp.]HKR89706.1 sugar transferase [Phenylobacterium sp.]